VNRHQKGKINLGFTEARDSEWQWHQVGHMQVCTSLQTAPQHSGFTGWVGGAENARPGNDGQRKLRVWKMQDWKMTDKNYGVWKMQDWKMTDKILANSGQNYGVWKMQEYTSS